MALLLSVTRQTERQRAQRGRAIVNSVLQPANRTQVAHIHTCKLCHRPVVDTIRADPMMRHRVDVPGYARHVTHALGGEEVVLAIFGFGVETTFETVVDVMAVFANVRCDNWVVKCLHEFKFRTTLHHSGNWCGWRRGQWRCRQGGWGQWLWGRSGSGSGTDEACSIASFRVCVHRITLEEAIRSVDHEHNALGVCNASCAASIKVGVGDLTEYHRSCAPAFTQGRVAGINGCD
jgi:hypothetical protein